MGKVREVGKVLKCLIHAVAADFSGGAGSGSAGSQYFACRGTSCGYPIDFFLSLRGTKQSLVIHFLLASSRLNGRTEGSSSESRFRGKISRFARDEA